MEVLLLLLWLMLAPVQSMQWWRAVEPLVALHLLLVVPLLCAHCLYRNG
jgi:hypothetical protein